MSVSANLPIENLGDPVENDDQKHIVPDDDESEQPLQPANIDDTIGEILDEKYPGFDPSLHAIDKETGKPKMRGDGSFALKRGPKGKGATVSRETLSKPKPETKQTEGPVFSGTAQDQISNQEAARQFCNLTVGIACAVIGPEWAPTNKAEGDALVTGFRNYFDAKGQIQLSPEWGLAFTVLAYTLPRIQHENTRTKFGKIKDWCVLKYVSLRERFGKKS